jgi:hypothetical protein
LLTRPTVPRDQRADQRRAVAPLVSAAAAAGLLELCGSTSQVELTVGCRVAATSAGATTAKELARCSAGRSGSRASCSSRCSVC